MKAVLTVAGFDGSNGAGVTKDLEVFSSLGLPGLSVPTCFVVQGPQGATAINPVSADLFSEMLRKAGDSFEIAGVKIGVLPEARHVDALVDFLVSRESGITVLDPVLAAKNGLRLMTDEALTALRERLLPLLTCITPNLDEAEALLGRRIRDLAGMEWAARELHQKGTTNVLVKGGHLTGEPVDLLFDGEEISTHRRKRTDREVHGTGCLFSSAITSFLVMNYPMKEAFRATEQAMDGFLRESSQPMETGYFYAFPALSSAGDGEKWQVLQAMRAAAGRLQKLSTIGPLPIGTMNVAYALRNARDGRDVAAFQARISRGKKPISFAGPPEFGALPHIARLCLACMKQYPFLRAGMDFRPSPATVEKVRKCGMTAISWDRMKAQGGSMNHMGKALDCLFDEAHHDSKTPPDIICAQAEPGTKPAVRLLGRDPEELIKKMERIRP
jgi:hydroxymethylpyrimidine kinase / phosphomethylpyrimidine kinase / thiamine-phosphate diphosphorylase